MPAYNLLRHYDSNGVFIGSVLPKSSLLAVSPLPNPGNSLLVINGDLILIYFRKSHLFTEVTTSGKLAGQWRIDPFPEITITGTAIGGSGEIYASANRKSGHPPYTAVYKLDKQSSRLVPLDTSSLAPNSEAIALLGNDTNRLVFCTSPPRTLRWVAVR